jgi:hypothetical protein
VIWRSSVRARRCETRRTKKRGGCGRGSRRMRRRRGTRTTGGDAASRPSRGSEDWRRSGETSRRLSNR